MWNGTNIISILKRQQFPIYIFGGGAGEEHVANVHILNGHNINMDLCCKPTVEKLPGQILEGHVSRDDLAEDCGTTTTPTTTTTTPTTSTTTTTTTTTTTPMKTTAYVEARLPLISVK